MSKRDNSISGSHPVYVFPTSFSQQRMWFINQLDPAGAVYNIPLVLRLIGDLNVDALRSSISGVVSRHEVLRTRFEVEDGLPVQVIAAEMSIDVPLTDLSMLSDGDR